MPSGSLAAAGLIKETWVGTEILITAQERESEAQEKKILLGSTALVRRGAKSNFQFVN